MPKQILNAELQNELQVSCSYEVMPNGETRTRMSFPNGSAYILTSREDCANGSWQNSHYHKSVLETYIVQEGKVAFARIVKGLLAIRIFYFGDVFTLSLIHI